MYRKHEFGPANLKPAVMHDHPGLHGDVDWHLLGVLPEYHGQGIGRKMLRYVRDELQKERGTLIHTALVRFNNPSSMRPVTQELNMSMVCFQGAVDQSKAHRDAQFFGSTETNLCGTSKIPSLQEPPIDQNTLVWNASQQTPNGYDFLIPVQQGEESELSADDETAIKMLKTIMAIDEEPTKGKHYIMRTVLNPNEVRIAGIPIADDDERRYLFFTKNW